MRELRQLGFKKCLNTYVLQSDGIDHARSSFNNARSLIACHRLTGQTFRDESADAVERNNVFEFNSVGKSPARGNDRITQLNSAEADLHVGLHGCGFSAGVFAGVFSVDDFSDALREVERAPRRVRAAAGLGYVTSAAGLRACFRICPTDADGWLTPSSEAKVAARSTGSTRP